MRNGGRCGLLVAAEEFLEGGDLGVQGLTSLPGDPDPRPGPAAVVTLLHLDQACLLQHGEVPGQVARGEFEGLPEIGHLHPFALGGDGQDAEPVTLVDRVVETVRREWPGYANFAVENPPLKLVLLEGEPGLPTAMDHLGVEVPTTAEVNAGTSRLTESGLTTLAENDTGCCYALQDKVWVRGPGDEP